MSIKILKCWDCNEEGVVEHGSEGKYFVCCDNGECDVVSKEYYEEDDAIKDWNKIQLHKAMTARVF